MKFSKQFARMTERQARRRRCGLPLFECSAYAAIPPTALSLWERGEGDLSPDRLERLEQVLARFEATSDSKPQGAA